MILAVLGLTLSVSLVALLLAYAKAARLKGIFDEAVKSTESAL